MDTNKIIIGFKNDDRIYEIPMTKIEKYPLSLFYGYMIENKPDEKIIINDINENDALNRQYVLDYDAFSLIYDVLVGKIKQYELPDDIQQILKYYGLFNDSLYGAQKKIIEKQFLELQQMEIFLNSSGEIFFPDTYQDYIDYKEILRYNKNIVPIQIMTILDKKEGVYYNDVIVNIFDGIPVGFNTKGVYNDDIEYNYLTELNIPTDVININEIRQNMLLKDHAINWENEMDKNEMNTSYLHLSPTSFYSKNDLAYLSVLLSIDTIFREDLREELNKNIYGYQKEVLFDITKRVEPDSLKTLSKQIITTLQSKQHFIYNRSSMKDLFKHSSMKKLQQKHYYGFNDGDRGYKKKQIHCGFISIK